MNSRIATAIVAVVSAAMSFAASAVTNYIATPLGTLGGAGSNGVGINTSGQSTGFSFTAGDAAGHAFRHSGGVIRDLGTLGGRNSSGRAINASGQVTGASDVPGNLNQHAFLYSGASMLDLGTLPGGAYSSAWGINAGAQVVGAATPAGTSATHAFLYSGGTMIDLGTLGGVMSTAMGINDSGQVTGDAQTVSGSFHPFLYAGGSMLDLGTLGGPNGSGTAINVSGQVAGFAETSAGPTHAFLYANGTMIDLGVLPGGSSSAGFGIDNKGQVVGFADFPGQTVAHAFIYIAGTMYDLNSLVVSGLGGMTLSIADDINDSGQIVGTACDAVGTTCLAFRLDPVTTAASASPVPALSQWTLLAMSMLMLGGASWLRYR